MSTGLPLARVEARAKVTGAARYALERRLDAMAYGWIVTATVARGRIAAIDTAAARAAPDVIAVLTHDNAPRLPTPGDRELWVLQEPRVAYRGQAIGVVVAESLEAAREAAALVRADYDAEPHDVILERDHPKLYRPEVVNPSLPTDTELGDFDGAFAAAAVRVDATYSTPAFHNNAMEPHSTLAVWDGDGLTLYDSSQGAPSARPPLARALGLPEERVRVVAEHVGGGFGSKGTPRPQAVLAALAAQAVGRPVKLAVTRQQMFALTGYRTPTIQRLRLGAGTDGRLVAIGHDVQEQTSTVREFAEQTATATRMMYAAPHRRTTHRVAALDVPTPSWMRAPGECPGMYALESAMDELAVAAGIDPVELRVRNDPDVDPEAGVPFSTRHLVACLRDGAERFGWAARDPRPGARRDGRWLVGSGVAASTYPARWRPAQAFARAEGHDRYVVGIGAADIGTGARTVLTQVAAAALGVEPGQVTMRVGDSALPFAPVAGGSAGTASWGSAVDGACRALRERLAAGDGAAEVTYDTSDDVDGQKELSRHAFGAQFAALRVDVDTGEIRVDRLLGVFAAGRILNPRTARSQFVGGMTMGLGMALTEESVMDAEFGDHLNHDLAQYHVPVNADVRAIEAHWIDEADPEVNPIGVKGIGEIGIVGTAAAVANAFFHATGIRLRDLPLRPDRVLEALAGQVPQ
ncbi:MAG: xanthine dehydrogenase family protein molybdopterin-binding subunit [Solirubrobacteraceae bacterium]